MTGHRKRVGPIASACLVASTIVISNARAAEPTAVEATPDPVAASLDLPSGMGFGSDTTVGSDQDLYLEVFFGVRAAGLIAHLQLREGRLFATADELEQLSINLPDGQASDNRGWIGLDSLQGLSYQYDAGTQRLILAVPISLRPEQRLGYRVPAAMKASRGSGVVLNYDAYGRSFEATGDVSVGTSVRWFGRAGTLSLSGVSHVGSGFSSGYERLDTRWSYSDPVRMWTWAAGDVISASLPWTRSVRLGGLQWRRNFTVRPDLITYPVAHFSGQTALPSTVELLVNNIQQFSAPINDGPFVLDSFPRITGAGEATLVVRDELGRVTQTTMPLYVDSQRLAPGLTDFSVEIGWLRRGYGGGESEYGNDIVASGSWRRGISPAVTMEAHAESGAGLQLLGAGLVWSPAQRWGLVTASAARSNWRGTAGTQFSLGYQWLGPRFGFDLWHQRASRDYNDIGKLGSEAGARLGRYLEQTRAAFWLPFRRGSLAFAHIQLKSDGDGPESIRTLSWSHTLPANIAFSASAFDSDLSGRGVGLSLSMPLGPRTDGSVSIDRLDGSLQTVASIRQTAAYDGGWGWELQAGDQQGGAFQASANVRGRWGDAWFGADHRPGVTGVFAQASGSVAWMAGHAFVGRRINDAFAVVSSNAIPGVPVQYENRRYGLTDSRGWLLLPDLLSWQQNKIAIDPDFLGSRVRMPALVQEIVPSDGAGVKVVFDIVRLHPAMVALLDPTGHPVPAGTSGRIERSGEVFLVGFDGEAYLENFAAGAALALPLVGVTCRYRLPDSLPGDDSMLPHIGPLACSASTP